MQVGDNKLEGAHTTCSKDDSLEIKELPEKSYSQTTLVLSFTLFPEYKVFGN